MKKQAGFTLVEIMIVVAIIGLLAAIAIPSFVKARNTARANACVNNLRQIDGAKEQLALADNLGQGDVPDNGDVESYLKDIPECPAGGIYDYGGIGTNPVCDYVDTDADHTL